jgi:hypothetical protein
MSDCTNLLLPPYGTYVRLLFDRNGATQRDLTIASENFRSGGSGRLKYLGWDRKILSNDYIRASQYSSQGRSWPTGRTYLAPHQWTGLLVLNHDKWKLLEDSYILQQDSMKPGMPDKDLLLYDHRIMHTEGTPIVRPEFDPSGAFARSGIREYWALFRTEFVKLELVTMQKLPETDEFQYLVDLELKERIPPLAALP